MLYYEARGPITQFNNIFWNNGYSSSLVGQERRISELGHQIFMSVDHFVGNFLVSVSVVCSVNSLSATASQHCCPLDLSTTPPFPFLPSPRILCLLFIINPHCLCLFTNAQSLQLLMSSSSLLLLLFCSVASTIYFALLCHPAHYSNRKMHLTLIPRNFSPFTDFPFVLRGSANSFHSSSSRRTSTKLSKVQFVSIYPDRAFTFVSIRTPFRSTGVSGGPPPRTYGTD